MFGALFAVIVELVLAAPLYADQVAHTTPSENHLTDRIVVDGKPTDVLSLDGIPIGPTWRESYLLGADENGRDLAVRLLYGARTTLMIGGGAVLLTLLLAVPLALAAGYLGVLRSTPRSSAGNDQSRSSRRLISASVRPPSTCRT